jgi:hypothetical protein
MHILNSKKILTLFILFYCIHTEAELITRFQSISSSMGNKSSNQTSKLQLSDVEFIFNTPNENGFCVGSQQTSVTAVATVTGGVPPYTLLDPANRLWDSSPRIWGPFNSNVSFSQNQFTITLSMPTYYMLQAPGTIADNVMTVVDSKNQSATGKVHLETHC